MDLCVGCVGFETLRIETLPWMPTLDLTLALPAFQRPPELFLPMTLSRAAASAATTFSFSPGLASAGRTLEVKVFSQDAARLTLSGLDR